MDGSRFDTLSKALGAGFGTRRGVLLAAAAGVGGALAAGEAEGKKKGKKPKPCPRGTTKCGVIKKKNGKKKFKCCRTIPASANPDPICAGIPSCCSTKVCGDGCICQTTIEGGGFCLRSGAEGCGADCASSDECPGGVCIFYGDQTTCGANVCCGHRPATCVPLASRCDSPGVCEHQSTCGPNCTCFVDVDDVLGCYDVTAQTTCCDANDACGDGEGCVAGACTGGGEAGRCFAFCDD
jgi:hypothetical protein